MMKQTKTLLMLILYFTTYNITTEHQTPPIHAIHNVLPMISDLEIAQKVSLCRLALFPSLLALVAYMHKNAITSTIYDNPLSFLAISYLLGNYLIDTAAKYQKINQTLRFLLLFHTMNRYMLCAFAIKNNILQRYKNHPQQLGLIELNLFDEHQFFQKITAHTGYTLEELEFFTTELIHQSMCTINDISLSNYQDRADDHMYFLLKDKITLEQVMAASKHDPTLYPALIKYMQNPEAEYESILETIGLLIKQQINSFIKKNLHIFPRVR